MHGNRNLPFAPKQSISTIIHSSCMTITMAATAISLPGGHSNFFGGYVLYGFSKVGSTEWIFSEKTRVLGTNFSSKLVCLELKFCQNWREMGLKMMNFRKTETEGIRTDTSCTKVGLWSGGGAWKRWSSERHIPVYLCYVSAPPPPPGSLQGGQKKSNTPGNFLELAYFERNCNFS